MMTEVNGSASWRALFLSDMAPTNRSIHDALVLFEHHPDMRLCLAYNTFSKIAVARQALPWHQGGFAYPRPIEDSDGMLAAGWVEQQKLMKLSVNTIKDCLVTVSKQASFNPLVDWLQCLQWDGAPRIQKWLSYYLGAEPTDYIFSVGPKFFISAVARAMRPGEKADCMLILEGPQGRFKSTAVRQLFGPGWYTDDLAEFTSKDAQLQMQGKWCIEMAELASFTKAEANRIKAVLSRQVDRFRAPYDRFVAEHPRQCIFVGTTNPIDGYFKDPTGSRRFWPVKCGTIDVDAILNDRDQLWAEAVHCFERGDKWWLEGDDAERARAEQDERREIDPWEHVITERLGGQTEIRVPIILTDWLGVPIERCGKSEQMRVASIFRAKGWERVKKRSGLTTEWVWRSPDHPTYPNYGVGTAGTLID